MGVILLAIVLIGGIVTIMNSIPLSIKTIYGYSKLYTGISPRGDPEMTPLIVKELNENAPVPLRRVILCRASPGNMRSIVGKWPFPIIGFQPEDLKFMLAQMGIRKIEGRMPKPGAPEIIVSEPILRNLDKKLGDVMLKPEDPDNYSPKPVRIVGVAQTDYWFAFNDMTYQEANHFPPIEHALAFAKTPADQVKLNLWAEEHFKGMRAQVFAYHILERDTDEMFQYLYRILNVVVGILVLVITIMMGMLMNIYQAERLVEFGLLQALGYTRRQLIGRVLREALLIVSVGWVLGVLGAYILLLAVKAQVFDPRAFALDPMDTVALSYSIPVPFAILLAAIWTVFQRFRKFDPVGVVERRLL